MTKTEQQARDSMDAYLSRNADKIKARHAETADYLEANIAAGSRDTSGNSIETLVAALRKDST